MENNKSLPNEDLEQVSGGYTSEKRSDYPGVQCPFCGNATVYSITVWEITAGGNKPTWGALALRTACRFIPLEGLSFIFESGWRHHTLIGNLHDKVSKTYVVKDVR